MTFIAHIRSYSDAYTRGRHVLVSNTISSRSIDLTHRLFGRSLLFPFSAAVGDRVLPCYRERKCADTIGTVLILFCLPDLGCGHA